MNPLGPSRTNLFLPECVKQPVDWMELSGIWIQVPEVIGMVIYPLQMALYVYFLLPFFTSVSLGMHEDTSNTLWFLWISPVFD